MIQWLKIRSHVFPDLKKLLNGGLILGLGHVVPVCLLFSLQNDFLTENLLFLQINADFSGITCPNPPRNPHLVASRGQGTEVTLFFTIGSCFPETMGWFPLDDLLGKNRLYNSHAFTAGK